LLDVDAPTLRQRALALAADEGVWTWPQAGTTLSPHRQRVELTVGDAAMQLDPADIRAIIGRLVD